ncbi:MAG TPA: pyrroline-5-carboxylate reductase [Steroidobacteraceae bacterium]|nr:pyrroline-5-carboxylate reductase [Steroidobacteraceae bacterium]
MAPMDVWQGDEIAFLGGGNMARALIAGLLRQGLGAGRIRVGEPHEALRNALAADFGVRTSADNAPMLAGATLVVLAVKPQDALTALQSLHAVSSAAPAPTLLSIAAGVTIASLGQACPPEVSIVRAMPNRPALVGAGVTGLYAPGTTPAAARAAAERVARAAGQAVWLRREAELDLVTALSGSGPAYFFLLAEQLAGAATRLGLAAETANLLAAETLYGAGLLAHRALAAESAGTLAAERGAVTSRGGTTEAALRVLADGGFESLVQRALQAAASRSAELAAAAAANAANTTKAAR